MIGAILSVIPTSSRHIISRRHAVAIIVNFARCGSSSGSITYRRGTNGWKDQKLPVYMGRDMKNGFLFRTLRLLSSKLWTRIFRLFLFFLSLHRSWSWCWCLRGLREKRNERWKSYTKRDEVERRSVWWGQVREWCAYFLLNQSRNRYHILRLDLEPQRIRSHQHAQMHSDPNHITDEPSPSNSFRKCANFICKSSNFMLFWSDL